MTKSLDRLQPGQLGAVAAVHTQGPMRRRLQELGLIEGTEVACVGVSPLGDPHAFLIRDTVIAIRCGDCQDILVRL